MADLSQTEELLRRHARNLVEYASREAGRETVQEANKDTGHMATTTYVEPVMDDGGFTFTADVVIPAEYAEFVIHGTKPHVIRPRKSGGVLAFESGVGGTVYAHVVHHPGYRGNDFFFAPMPERWQRKLEEAINMVVTQ